jgi:hypothetical protein
LWKALKRSSPSPTPSSSKIALHCRESHLPKRNAWGRGGGEAGRGIIRGCRPGVGLGGSGRAAGYPQSRSAQPRNRRQPRPFFKSGGFRPPSPPAQRPEPAPPSANPPRSTEAHPRLTRMQRRLCCSCRVTAGPASWGPRQRGRWAGSVAGLAPRVGGRGLLSGLAAAARPVEGRRCSALSLLMAVSLRHRRRRAGPRACFIAAET